MEVTRPWLVSSERFSDAGTFKREAVWDFGVWPAPLLLILFIKLIRSIDGKLEKYCERRSEYSTFVLLMILAMLSGTLLNVIWGSVSTVAARTLFPLAMIIVMCFWNSKTGPRRTR